MPIIVAVPPIASTPLDLLNSDMALSDIAVSKFEPAIGAGFFLTRGRDADAF
jgi:hypothetical protein